jgi:predicted esterase
MDSSKNNNTDSSPSATKPATLAAKVKKKIRVYPPPFTLAALGKHTHTIIFLHGRGSTSPQFGPPLHQSILSSGRTFADEVPNMKFIFPAASLRRAQAFNRSTINQWFDNWSLDDISLREELQYEGLRESTQFLPEIIDDEARLVGCRNVFIGGLS